MPIKPNEIMPLLSRFHETRILLTAAEMDVFTLVEKNPMSAPEIADHLKANLRGITILLDAVVSMGLLEKREGKCTCPAEVASLLSKNSKTSILPMVMLSVGGWKRWGALTDIVRQGKGENRGPGLDFKEREQEFFIGAMHAVA